MSSSLPEPEVLHCYLDDRFRPPLSARVLRWGPEALAEKDQVWDLPAGVRLSGPPPDRFGINVQRCRDETLNVRLLWNQIFLAWHHLAPAELLDGSLAPLLKALGLDLWCLLDQPLSQRRTGPDPAA